MRSSPWRAAPRAARIAKAHGAYFLHLSGGPVERITALWDFRTSTLFSDADRAALELALASGTVPDAATPGHFEELRKHFSDKQISELLAVIALSGFFNRYSDTLAIVTDQEWAGWAKQFLAPVGWQLGKHSGAPEEQRAAFPRMNPE